MYLLFSVTHNFNGIAYFVFAKRIFRDIFHTISLVVQETSYARALSHTRVSEFTLLRMALWSITRLRYADINCYIHYVSVIRARRSWIIITNVRSTLDRRRHIDQCYQDDCIAEHRIVTQRLSYTYCWTLDTWIYTVYYDLIRHMTNYHLASHYHDAPTSDNLTFMYISSIF